MKKLFTLIGLLIAPIFLIAQANQILKQINAGATDGLNIGFNYNSNEQVMYFQGGMAFSRNLWKTDATTEGTVKVINANMGDINYIQVDENDHVYFSVFQNDGVGVYTNDGSTNHLVELFKAPDGEAIQDIQLIEDGVIFLTTKSDTLSIYKSQGQANDASILGTFILDLSLEAATHFENFVVYYETSTSSNLFEPFMTDGTEQGTMTVEEYLESLGSTIDVESARGTGDVLFVTPKSSNTEYAIYKNNIYNVNIGGTFRSAVSAGKNHFAFGSFGSSVFDTLTKTVTDIDIDFNFFADPIAHNEQLYYLHNDRFVYHYDIDTKESTQISTEEMGLNNFSGQLWGLGDLLLYYRKQNIGNEIRYIDLTTGEDKLMDLYSESSFLNPATSIINEKLIYAKFDNDNGYELWTFDPSLATTSKFESSLVIDISIFPNPSSDKIFVDLPNNVSNGQLYIYNQNGQLIKMTSARNNRQEINISDLQNGQYFIQFFEGLGLSKGVPFSKI